MRFRRFFQALFIVVLFESIQPHEKKSDNSVDIDDREAEIDVEYRCAEFGFNWAAEIRCLRQLLQQCEMTHEPTKRLRGARTLDVTRPYDRRYNGRYQGANGRYQSQGYDSREVFTNQRTQPVRAQHIYPHQTSREETSSGRSERSVTQKEFEQKLTTLEKSHEKKMQDLEAKLNQYIRLIEEKASTEVLDMRRRFETEIKKLNKRITFLSAKYIDGKEYLYMEERLSWYLAEESCNEWGGHLASVHNSKLNRQLAELIRDEGAWIATNDVQRENELVNSDYSRVDFVHWKKDQPDNANHNENCVLLAKDGYWSDEFCMITKPYICSRPASKN